MNAYPDRESPQRRDSGEHRPWRERRLRQALESLIDAVDIETPRLPLGMATALDEATLALLQAACAPGHPVAERRLRRALEQLVAVATDELLGAPLALVGAIRDARLAWEQTR